MRIWLDMPAHIVRRTVPSGGIWHMFHHLLCMMNPQRSMVHLCAFMFYIPEGLPKAVSHAHQLHRRQSGGHDLGDVPDSTAHGWNPICPGVAACGLCDTHRNAAWLRLSGSVRCPKRSSLQRFVKFNCLFEGNRHRCCLRFPPFVSAAVALLQRHTTDEPFGTDGAVHLGIWRDLGLSWRVQKYGEDIMVDH